MRTISGPTAPKGRRFKAVMGIEEEREAEPVSAEPELEEPEPEQPEDKPIQPTVGDDVQRAEIQRQIQDLQQKIEALPRGAEYEQQRGMLQSQMIPLQRKLEQEPGVPGRPGVPGTL